MTSENISQLIVLLSNSNMRVRQKAVEELGLLGSESQDTIKYLVSSISNFISNRGSHGSLEIDLCISELRTLVLIAEKPLLISELVKQLHNNLSWEVREQVAKSLGQLGAKAQEAIPELESRFSEDQNLNVRYSSKIAVSIIKETQIPIDEIFFDIFVNGEMNVNSIFEKSDKIIAALNAFNFLGKMANSALSNIHKLEALLNSYPDRQSLDREKSRIFDLLRLNIIQSIFKIEDQKTLINEILMFLENGNVDVRKTAVAFLKELNDVPLEAIDRLRARFFTDASEDVRIEAFNAVIKILKDNRESLIQELINGAKNSNKKVCQRAIWELEVLEEEARESLPVLRKIVLQSEDEISRDSLNAIIAILRKYQTDLQKELILNVNHPLCEIQSVSIKKLTEFGYSSIEYFDKLITLAASKYDEILREAIKVISVKETHPELIQKCINLLESDNPKLVPYKLIEDINTSTEVKENFLNSLWRCLVKYQNINSISIEIFDFFFLMTDNRIIDFPINNVIKYDNLSVEIKYWFLFSKNSLGRHFIDQWQISEKEKLDIIKIIIEFINNNYHKNDCVGKIDITQKKAIQWLKQNVLFDKNLPSNLYQELIQVLRKLAFNDSFNSDVQLLAKEALPLNRIDSYKQFSIQSENENEKEVLEITQKKTFAEQISYIQELIEADPKERDENLQHIVDDLWIQWIVDLDNDKASLVRITADKIRNSIHSVIPLINRLEQGWQPKDDFREKIRNKIIKNQKKSAHINSDSLLSHTGKANIEGLRDWLATIKERPSSYSEQIRAEFDKKQNSEQLAEKVVEILVQEEIDNYALQVKKRIARQLADMSDDRFFANAPEEYNNIKDELRKHAVPALSRRLPEESDIEIRESMARILGNVGGTFAVDALAKAVVGEERTRTARQDLLSKYYLDPSKARSEEAASILKEAVQEAKKTLWMLQGLNIAVFATGIIMLTGGVFTSLNGENDANKRIAGGLAGIGGFSGLIVQMVNDPLKRIQNAMSNLIQAEMAFTSFIWGLNLNGTYIQSQYVAEGILSNEEIAHTVHRIENSMNLTMNLVSEHLNSDNQGIFPRINSVVPLISEVGNVITVYGQNLKKRDATNRLVAINHRLIDSEIITDWNETVVKFKLTPQVLKNLDSEQRSVWISLFVDGIESNVIPLQILNNSSTPLRDRPMLNS
jgi:hypothetical protein